MQIFFAVWTIISFILIPFLLIAVSKAQHRAKIAEAELHLTVSELKALKGPNILHG